MYIDLNKLCYQNYFHCSKISQCKNMLPTSGERGGKKKEKQRREKGERMLMMKLNVNNS